MKSRFAKSLSLLAIMGGAPDAAAQERPPTASAGDRTSPGAGARLDTLVARALAVHPTIRAAVARAEAARARISPAGAWTDPMLMAGLENVPVTDPGGEEMMKMKVVGLGQTVPYPGKTRLRREVASRELIAAEIRLQAAGLEVEEKVRNAFYELAYLDRALEITRRNQELLAGLSALIEARYGVGAGSQQEVLQARGEATELAGEAVSLLEERRIATARLNEALDRYSETPVPEARIPERIARAAVSSSPARIRFASPSLGSRAADSPFPELRELEELAVVNSPVLREHTAMIGAGAARVELARKEFLPDFDLSIRYGQRTGFSDMVSATVSVPLPVNRRRNRDLEVAGAADLLASEHARHEARNAVRLEVARLHSELERDRAQLALYVKAIIPQTNAMVESANAGFQAGRVELLALLEHQATLYGHEAAYHRLLSDFAQRLAALERVVGREILR